MSSKQKQEPEEVQVNGKTLSCVVCSNRQFWIRSAQLNTAASTFFGFDWTDHSRHLLYLFRVHLHSLVCRKIDYKLFHKYKVA